MAWNTQMPHPPYGFPGPSNAPPYPPHSINNPSNVVPNEGGSSCRSPSDDKNEDDRIEYPSIAEFFAALAETESDEHCF